MPETQERAYEFYNNARYLVEDRARRELDEDKRQDLGRQVAEELGQHPLVVAWFSHFPRWQKRILQFRDDCLAVAGSAEMSADYQAITLENGASAAEAMGDHAHALELRNRALNVINTPEWRGTKTHDWIVASVEMGKMQAAPETFDLQRAYRYAYFMTREGLFNAPGRAEWILDVLKQHNEDPELVRQAEELLAKFYEVSEQPGRRYSIFQTERAMQKHPQVRKLHEG